MWPVDQYGAILMCEVWVDELMGMISGRELSLDAIRSAQDLKYANFPVSLYKYRVVNQYSLSNLANATLYLAAANAFNDPYDSAVSFDPLFGETYAGSLSDAIGLSAERRSEILNGPDPMRAVLEEMLKVSGQVVESAQLDVIQSVMSERHEVMKAEIVTGMNERLRSSYKVCSLTERLDSLPLWAHYADNHKGFAMEYDFKNLPFDNIMSYMLWPVRYRGIFNAADMLKGVRVGMNFNNLFALVAALHKSSDWAYEQEWRLVLPDGEAEQARNFDAPLKAVHLGTNISSDDERLVRESARIANVPVFKMRLIPHRFSMESVG
ncbi:DUF2971 domain-containing protein [Pseudomonas farsensis]|uniref:DUF2971 domain-containing protein n=1 Tax=Pseudomonas farsensis TaxID=2745492 RepID=A0ABU8QLZ1_9PSED